MNKKPSLKSSGGFRKVIYKDPIGLFSEMGIRNSGTSSSENISFTDLERVISGLLEDCSPEDRIKSSLPKQRSWNDIFIEEKSNYFIQVCSNIMYTKERFLQYYASINESIEEMTRRILQAVTARERELKAQLQLIRAEKVAKWDRQLSACGDALERLYTWEKSFSSPENGSTINYLSDDDLFKELEFVDAGLVNLDLGGYSKILESLHTLGETTYVSSNWDALKSITPKLSFGSDGDKKGQFCRPWGVCSDATGRILVCDRSNHRIQIFNECGQFLIEFGKLGSESGEFNRPSGIDVDYKCRIIVADKDNHRIQVFTYSGFFLLKFGTRGTEPGEFMYPWDVSVNRNCDIAVSDSKNNRVQLFDEGGRFITLFDAKSMGIGPRWSLKFLDSPRGLAFRPDGSLLVTDLNNHQVLLISKDFKEVKRFGQQGSHPAEFFRPQGIACDKTGKFAVADSKNYRVQVFDASGRFLKSFGSKGADLGQFDCPQGICFHPNQNILVVDLNNNRVQIF